jgi:hypothetical protein
MFHLNNYKIMTKEQALDVVEKAIDIAFERGKGLSMHSVSSYFSFAKYLDENFHCYTNIDGCDVYRDNSCQGLYSEKDIYDEWLNNRLRRHK